MASRLNRVVGYLIPITVSAALIVFTLRHSMEHGRLRTYPIVDNVNYMARGLQWLTVYRDGGVGALVTEYLRRPPHSPYSVFSAFAAYLTAGIREEAVHAVQGVAIVLALCFVWWRVRCALWMRLGVLIVVASLPLWHWCIEVFKPDYISAVLTTCGVWLILRRPWGGLPSKTWFGAGLLCGAAIFAKPVVFPGVLFAFASAAAGRVASRLILGRRPTLAWAPRAMLLGSAGCVLVAGPHFVVASHRVVRYIEVNLVGSKADSWAFHGSPVEHALYFLTGTFGRAMLGHQLWVLGGALIVLLSLSLRLAASPRGRRVSVAGIAAWACAIMGPYLLAAVNPMKVREFGLVFQLLLAFGAAESANLAWRWIRRSWRLSTASRARPAFRARWLSVCGWASVILLATVIASTWRWGFGTRDAAELTLIDARTRLARMLFDDLRQMAAERSSEQAAALELGVVGSPSHLGTPLFTIWSERDRANIRAWSVYEFEANQVAADLASADVVLAHEPNTRMARDRGFPGLDEQFVKYLHESLDWRLAKSYPSPHTGRPFLLFERVTAKPARRDRSSSKRPGSGINPEGDDE